MPVLPSSASSFFIGHDVADERVAQLGRPVPAGRAGHVALVVGGRIDVHFDDADVRRRWRAAATQSVETNTSDIASLLLRTGNFTTIS